MSKSSDRVVIIGGGPNGLVAAYYLAKAGLKPLVLERRKIIGGLAVTEEFHRGFKAPTLMHSVGPLIPGLLDDLQLERHGLSLITPEVRVFAPLPDGRSVTIFNDSARTARELAAVSAHDAKAYPDFVASFAAIGKVIAPLISMTPPSISEPTKGELWNLGKLGLKFRGLSRKNAFRLLRWGPMAVADLASEWFENETLRAIVAARGIYGAFAGPWSAGTSASLLLQAAFDGSAIASALFVKRGIGGFTEALAKAATTAGAQIRTGSGVQRIAVKGGKAISVITDAGEEIPAAAIVSNVDPKTTYLQLLDVADLDPDFRFRIGNYRSTGAAAKVNLALGGLPAFNGVKDPASLAGRIHIGPEIDHIERAFDAAKYGDFSEHPYLDVTIPSLTDPSLAPGGAHVMSIHVQYAPYKLRGVADWNARRDELGDAVVRTLSAYAPNIARLIQARQVLTPVDLEKTYGLGGGHLLHGEPALDQLFTFRPMLGWAQYRTPIKGLYLCGSGTHPGGGITGAPGTNAAREIVKDLS
jgi:phytoene dehydrogenase-like protein